MKVYSLQMVKARSELDTLSEPPSVIPAQPMRSEKPVAYDLAIKTMDDMVARTGISTPDRFWFLEHPSLITAGTSAQESDLKAPDRFPIFSSGRGGQYTYHGPGQRVVYAIVDLRRRGNDVRRYVFTLEQVIIDALLEFNIIGERRDERVGVWVKRPDRPALSNGGMREDKIAAIGIRVRRGIAFHGISINLEPDLSHFDAIVPCGVSDHGVTSLVDLGLPVTMDDLDIALARNLQKHLGPMEPFQAFEPV